MGLFGRMVSGRWVNPIAKKPIARASCNLPVADIAGGLVCLIVAI